MKKTLKKTITHNLVGLMGITSIILVSFYFYFLKEMNSVKNYATDLKSKSLVVTQKVQEMQIAIIQTQQFLQDISATRAAEGFADGFNEAENWSKIFYKNYDYLMSHSAEGDIIRTKLPLLKKSYDEFYEKGKIMANLYIKEGPESGNKYMHNFDEIAEKMDEEILNLKHAVEKPVTDSFVKINDEIAKIYNLVKFGFLIFLVGFILISVINIKKLMNDINIVLNELADVVSGLATAAKQSIHDSNVLNRISDEQMSSLTDTVAAAHEIDQMVDSNKRATKLLQGKAQSVKDLAENGLKIVENLHEQSKKQVDSSAQFQSKIDDNLKLFESVQKSISQIKEKTTVINDIVFQTKLLSFNAQIEAARAGEYGRGFAVVAEEVGKLAVLSNQAAQSINQIIDTSIGEIQGTVKTVNENVGEITKENIRSSEASRKGVIECKKSFEIIYQNVEELSSESGNIAVSTEQQSVALTQLNQTAHELQNTSETAKLSIAQSISNVDEISKNIESLVVVSNKIDYLKESFSKFKWDQSLSLDIPEMDQEHIKLIEKMNLVIDGIENKIEVTDLFVDLINYTKIHFDNEEKFMKSNNYSKVSSHAKIHENLLNKLGGYKKDFENGNTNYSELIAFLKNWLMTHIKGIDMNYSKEIKK